MTDPPSLCIACSIPAGFSFKLGDKMKKKAANKRKGDQKTVRESKKDITASKFYSDIHHLIEEARHSVASTVNAGMTILYWQIGNRITNEILKGNRAEYGKEIVVSLARQLTVEYGNSFSEKNLRRMIQFSEVYPSKEIVVSLIRQLSWTHFIALIPLKESLQREFYTQLCRVERWSVRTLRQKIDSMLYERTAISKKPQKLAKQELTELRANNKVTPDLVFRDPYVLDFLNLKDTFSESDLEMAILRELESFILELGAGFSFVARQKRMTIDNEDFYLDLLFFHRKLKRLVAIELKLGKFKAAHKGQMELYLRWLKKYEKEDDENDPLGLILCAEGSHEQIELMELHKASIKIAEYLTELPPKELLEKKLHAAIEKSRALLEQREDNHD
jgi:predicted nuclease of restriction endonuclease-like (RecB) superfamily